MNKGLHIGNPFGIGVYVHWTFALLLAWVGFAGLASGGIGSAAFSLLLVTALFACVVLHELGHSLAGRRFGIPTRSITLYPIGGVAQLEGIPRQPKQELIIALAGPAVNVVIAALLLPIAIMTGFGLPTGVAPSTFGQFVATLTAANIVLVLFNLIPAFPMDGGRVLRALLAMGGNYRWATNVAARIGQGLAILFVLAGLGVFGFWNPLLIVIGGFIFLAAGSERLAARQPYSYTAPSPTPPRYAEHNQQTWARGERSIPDSDVEIISPEESRRRWGSSH